MVIRTLRNNFGVRKNPLPQQLLFLKEVKYYSIAEHITDGKSQIRIEFLLKPLKEIIEAIIVLSDMTAKFKEDCRELTDEVLSLKKVIEGYKEKITRLDEDYKEKITQLDRANNQLMLNLTKYEDIASNHAQK